MIDTPQVVQTTPQLTATLHLTVPRNQIRDVMGPSIQTVLAAITAQGIAPSGPWFTHHLRSPSDTFDFEVCVPVSAAIQPADRVLPGRWPAMRVARTIYNGPYEGLASAWAEFSTWIEAQQLQTAQDLWERYLVGPESTADPANFRTELNRPLSD